MSGYVLKPADEIVSFEMDWSKGYLAEGERISADLGWSVQPDLGAASELMVAEQGHDKTRSWAAFRGGVKGRVYMVSNRVRTYDDRVLSRAIVMRIALPNRLQ
jgi:hypothetical protein